MTTKLVVISAGLSTPWSVDFIPADGTRDGGPPTGSMLVTERAGKLRVFANGKLSEPIANTCFARALQREGLNWSVEETMRRLMGRSMKSCMEIVEGELGRALPVGFVDRLQADTLQAFHDAPLRAVPGVIAAIDAIEAAGAAGETARFPHFPPPISTSAPLFLPEGARNDASQIP